MHRFNGRGIALVCGAALALFLLITGTAGAAGRTAPVTGLHKNTPRVVALENADIVTGPGKILEKATLIVRDGLIDAVGRGIEAPPDAVKRDLKGKVVYPGFIDLFTSYGIPESDGKGSGQKSGRAGAGHWNPGVRPETEADRLLKPDPKAAAEYRKSGFTAVVSYPAQGIVRGSGALVLLLDNRTAQRALMAQDVAQAVSFDKGKVPRRGVEGYPASMMGHVALLRQSFLDALWYTRAWQAYGSAPTGQEAPEKNVSLEALGPYAAGAKPVLLDAVHELDIYRAARLTREFGLRMWIVGTGYEYRRLDAFKASGIKVILPLDFPGPPDVSTRALDMDLSLRDLRHWDFAPENPAMVSRAGVDFALTAARLEKPSGFLKRVRKAVKRGLAPEAALKALTVTPAGWLGVQSIMGTIDKGKIADLVIADRDIFSAEGKVLETWVAGVRYEIAPEPLVEARGTWRLELDKGGSRATGGTLEIAGKPEKLEARLLLREGETKVKITKAILRKRLLTLVFPGDSLGLSGVLRLTGTVADDAISGTGIWGDGGGFAWEAGLEEPFCEKRPDSVENKNRGETALEVVCPEGAFGRSGQPAQPAELLVRGATLWTCGPAGVIENADLLVKSGKIAAVGKNLRAGGRALVIEAAGKHVTPGLIDAHSHIAITRGVNEGTHPVSSEVRIEDVINCDDINIYRQLAGGLTAALTLHGSANPIGGQNALVKLRWGASPEQMLLTDGWPTLKMALGENVTQAWALRPDRYPATRMGVDQILRDWFGAAKDYRRGWEIYHEGRKKNAHLIPPRKNLRLEPLLEVLDGKRVVHCHSYRQDEILNVMRLADELGFRIGVFVHNLEGYKVAEAMREHGAMPTVFTDWWSYKYEAYDAIPFNGALLHEQGLLVSFNSDNAELARRMNLEAAKAVKYGGVP
ncbi:MAG: amidohydrolase family protein, partial [Gemmatimonadota bacterium]|nr:amidohydrolase family protein [Gemmatimonadota bacterium]